MRYGLSLIHICKALKKCEECTQETYENARSIDHECVYSCHAGLIKWAVPVKRGDFHCVIVSEGVLAMKQMEDADKWAKYLSREYQLDEAMLLKKMCIRDSSCTDNFLLILQAGLLIDRKGSELSYTMFSGIT